MQVALLNNRAPGHAELGVAQADLVQAGLLATPCLMGRPSSGLLAGRSTWNCVPPCAFSIFFSCRFENV